MFYLIGGVETYWHLADLLQKLQTKTCEFMQNIRSKSFGKFVLIVYST